MAMKNRYKLAWVFGSLTVAATFIANVKAVLQPAMDYGAFLSRVSSIEKTALAAQTELTDHEKDDQKDKIALARELGGIAASLRSIDEHLNKIDNTQTVMWKAIKKEIT